MKRAAFYARYSSKLQKATSIEDQVAKGKKYCAAQNYELVAIFTDGEMTGRNMRRPGLIELKGALVRREIDIIIVEAMDRLGRRVVDSLNFFDLTQFGGVELHSLDEGPQDFVNVLLRSYAAQQFSEMIGEHTRRGMQGGLTRGRLHTSAYGYRKIETDEGLNREVDQVEAEIVRRIFREAAEGHSAKSIAVALNKDGIPAPRGGTWDASTIRGNKARHEGILNNRLYIGEASVCKVGRRYHPETGEKAVFLTNDAEMKVFEALRIVPQEVWDTAPAEAAKRTRSARVSGNPQSARRSKHLLSGLMFCGSCGHSYVKVGKSRFGCREARKHACGNRVTIAQGAIEGRTFKQLREVLSAPDLIQHFEEAFRAEMQQLGGEDTKAALKTTARKLAGVQKARRGIMAAIEGGADFADYSERDKELKAEGKALEAHLESLKLREAAKARSAPDMPALFAQALKELEALLGSPETVVQANEHLSALIRRITLTPAPKRKAGCLSTSRPIWWRYAPLPASAATRSPATQTVPTDK